MESGDHDWATTLVALPSQVDLIFKKDNLIYESQCFVFRSLVDSVAQYAQLWIRQFREEIRTAAAVGEELIRVLKRGMELVTFCADKTSPGVILIILGSLGQFREIIDDVRRYSQMVNQLVSNSIFIGEVEYKKTLIDRIHSKVQLDCKTLDTNLEKAFNEDNLPSATTLRVPTSKWQPYIYRIFSGSSENTALNRFCSLLEKGVLPTIDINDLSFQSDLGKGSFGKVGKFLWCHTIAVAVKEFRYISHFEDELQIYKTMKSDDSAHIVQMLGYYETEEIVGEETFSTGHLVLELMESNLDIVIGDIEVTILQRVDILLQIAKAMKCLHGKDVIYRDLKPANILFNRNKDKSFHIKLADFGISKTNFDTLHTHTGYQGTKMYMAPEMLVEGNTNYSRKVDVYSFGVVSSQILTSTLTRTLENRVGKQPMGLIRDILKQKSLEKGIPERLKRLIADCWEKNDNKRPSFQHICEELWFIKEKLLLEKGEDYLIQNAFKDLGIDKDNYHNFAAVCGG